MTFWGVKCKGCGGMHPTAMFRKGDTSGRVGPNEPFEYTCPRDNKAYEYLGKEERTYDYEDSSGSSAD
jgi:hypothetical protein